MIALFNIRRGKKCWLTEKWTYRQTDRLPPWPRSRKYIQTKAWKNLDAHLLRSPSYPHESWEHLVLDQEQLPSFTTIRFQWTHFSLSLSLFICAIVRCSTSKHIWHITSTMPISKRHDNNQILIYGLTPLSSTSLYCCFYLFFLTLQNTTSPCIGFQFFH